VRDGENLALSRYMYMKLNDLHLRLICAKVTHAQSSIRTM
jgi:hypothetical protein